MKDVVIVGACRTPIGRLGGTLKDVGSVELSSLVMQEAIKRAGIDPKSIDDVIWGECQQQADKCNIARVAALKSGLQQSVTGVSVNRVCTSSLQAIVFAAQAIKAGDADVLLVISLETWRNARQYLGRLYLRRDGAYYGHDRRKSRRKVQHNQGRTG